MGYRIRLLATGFREVVVGSIAVDSGDGTTVALVDYCLDVVGAPKKSAVMRYGIYGRVGWLRLHGWEARNVLPALDLLSSAPVLAARFKAVPPAEFAERLAAVRRSFAVVVSAFREHIAAEIEVSIWPREGAPL